MLWGVQVDTLWSNGGRPSLPIAFSRSSISADSVFGSISRRGVAGCNTIRSEDWEMNSESDALPRGSTRLSSVRRWGTHLLDALDQENNLPSCRVTRILLCHHFDKDLTALNQRQEMGSTVDQTVLMKETCKVAIEFALRHTHFVETRREKIVLIAIKQRQGRINYVPLVYHSLT